MNKREKFLYYMNKRAKLRDPYVWGGQGQKLRKTSLIDICSMETSIDNANKVLTYVAKNMQQGHDMSKCKIFDCSGLVTYYLMKLGVISSDMRAQGLYERCLYKKIEDAEPGDLLFRGDSINDITHVGVYMGEMRVIEAKGRAYGVCNTSFESGGWRWCGNIFKD